MLTDGQEIAVDQIQVLANNGESIELLDISEPNAGGSISVSVSIDARFPSTPKGIQFRPRERLIVDVPADFPWSYPRVRTPHVRWSMRPHVNYRNRLCLYLAPDVEWNPSDGMFGLFDRLVEWLRLAAINELDPEAAPLHPPYAPVSRDLPTVIPRTNTPTPSGKPWIGFAPIEGKSDSKVELRRWIPMEGDWIEVEDDLAIVVLSHEPLPYQYPTRLGPFIRELEGSGIEKGRLLRLLGLAALANKEGQPLFVVIGTPMRRIEAGEPRQHLAVWHVDATDAGHLRTALPRSTDSEELAEIRGEMLELMMKWADAARIKWCFVDEARSEVTRSRDGESPLTEFTGRSVALLGCGAIGSHLSDHIMRVNPSELTVVDNSIVRYGNLSRQNYDSDDLTKDKAASLARRLARISSDVSIIPLIDNALDLIANPDSKIWQADVIIDATANAAVSKRLEAALASRVQRPWIVSMLLGHRGHRGLLAAMGPAGVGGPVRAIRETKLKVIGAPRLQSFADEFWPDPPRSELFLPEPGCSAPTFIGANADVAAVVGALARAAGDALRATEPATAMLFELADATSRSPARSERLSLANPIQLREAIAGYRVHVEQRVMAEIRSVIHTNGRTNPDSETGGLLFGEMDDATQTITVTYALGPPPDSQSSPSGFVCGTSGVDAASAALLKASRGTHVPIGMWHTHPNGNPSASATDLAGMRLLTGQRERPLPKQLLMIGGGDPLGSAWNTYLFDRHHTGAWPVTTPTAVPAPIPTTGKVGLALSGGGLRAAAFHLGCMRALHDRGLLNDVRLISGVSGGSLIAAMWAYEDDSFADFDERVSELLSRGLASRIARRWIGPKRLARAAITTATAGVASAPNAWMGRGGNRPRSTSSLTALEESLTEFFGETRLSDVARADLNVVINACDLRTGSAFRFGNAESGTWRYGVIKGNDVPVARAVACSAAYPLVFPAHDSIETLERRDGSEHQRRLILTDGGIFDNLGTSALLPDRSATFSTNVHAPLGWVIACDAGRGMSHGTARPYWFMDRLKRSFEATYKKGQDTERARLFELGNRPSPVKGFVVAMLGMNDANLPIPMADLVPRESVIDVKTSFTALPQDDIDRLTRRGEQIMGSLIARYGPHP